MHYPFLYVFASLLSLIKYNQLPDDLLAPEQATSAGMRRCAHR